MIDVSEISRRLSEQAESVCRHLLPNGTKTSREWEVGSPDGEAGKSCKIVCDGSKAGVWKDFASDEGGDLLDLWMAAQRVDLGVAVKEAKAFLGIDDSQHEKSLRSKPKKYKRPDRPAGARKIKEESPVMKYLKEERKITQEAIDAYGVAELDKLPKHLGETKGPWIVFPFKRDGELIGIKYLHLERKDGKKQIVAEGNCEPTLFGWDVVPAKHRFLIITEGEMDALSLFSIGVPALSVPFGGGGGKKQQWIDSDWGRFDRFNEIFLCLDNDEPGKEGSNEIAERLGLYRCKFVSLPKKDVNECLVGGVSKSEIITCLSDAKTRDPKHLVAAIDYTEEIISRIHPTGGKKPGFNLPWEKMKDLRIEHGTLVVWTGFNGHGKSQKLGQVMLAAIQQRERVCIASFEMHPAKTLSRMVRQATGQEKPSREDITAEMKRTEGSLWIFDLVGTGKVKTLIDVFEYAFRRYGIRQFVIDSMMKVGLGEDDYNGQKEFADTLADLCKRLNITIHLVAHARKGNDELAAPGKMDIKGSGGITDLADYVFSVFRNKNKERILDSIREGTGDGKISEHDARKMYDSFLICCKNREDGDLEGMYGLYFDKRSLNYDVEQRH